MKIKLMAVFLSIGALYISWNYKSYLASFLLPDIPLAEVISKRSKADPFNFTVKLWAHRTNTPTRAKLAAKKYGAMELDVIFSGNEFDVTHDKHLSTNTNLEEYLGALNEPSDLLFWLDVKNLTKSNRVAMLERLEKVVERYRLDKNNLIVESHDFESLGVFSDNGYLVSYYLPIGRRFYSYAISDRHEFKNRIVEINKNLLNSPYLDFISVDNGNYYVVEKYFKNHDVLTWSSSFNRKSSILARMKIDILTNEQRIKIFLVRMDSEDYI